MYGIAHSLTRQRVDDSSQGGRETIAAGELALVEKAESEQKADEIREMGPVALLGVVLYSSDVAICFSSSEGGSEKVVFGQDGAPLGSKAMHCVKDSV